MKIKVLKILLTVFALLVLVGVLFIKLTSDKAGQNTAPTTDIDSVSAAGFDEEGSEKTQRAQALAEKMQNSVPPEIFGGLYFDDNQVLVVNVTDLTADSVLQLKNEVDSQDVIFRQVKHTLAFLESVRSELIPFMAEYGIATIDANEAANKIDIELYEENKEVEKLISKYISLDYVTITVLPDDVEIVFA